MPYYAPSDGGRARLLLLNSWKEKCVQCLEASIIHDVDIFTAITADTMDYIGDVRLTLFICTARVNGPVFQSLFRRWRARTLSALSVFFPLSGWLISIYNPQVPCFCSWTMAPLYAWRQSATSSGCVSAAGGWFSDTFFFFFLPNVVHECACVSVFPVVEMTDESV